MTRYIPHTNQESQETEPAGILYYLNGLEFTTTRIGKAETADRLRFDQLSVIFTPGSDDLTDMTFGLLTLVLGYLEFWT